MGETELDRLVAELTALELRLDSPEYLTATPKVRLDEERQWRSELRARIEALRDALAKQVTPVVGGLPADGVGRWAPLPLFDAPQPEESGDLPPAPLAVDETVTPDREVVAREVTAILRGRGGNRRLGELRKRWGHDAPSRRLIDAALVTRRNGPRIGRIRVPARDTVLRPTEWLTCATELPNEFDGLTATQRVVLIALRVLAPPGRPFVRLSEIAYEVGVRAGIELPMVERALISLGHPSLRRLPLIEMQGFSGRFTPPDTHLTHARLTPIAIEVLDETLPIPLLLINGAEGQGASIPPHRAEEVIRACLGLLTLRNMRASEVFELMPGPEFPDGGEAISADWRRSWWAGKAMMQVDGRVRPEFDETSQRSRLVVSEVPWPRSPRDVLADLNELKHHGHLDGVTEIIDLSSASGCLIHLELEHLAFRGLVHSAIEESQLLACTWPIELRVHGSTAPMQLVDFLSAYLEHRREVAVKKLDRRVADAQLRAQNAEAVCVALELMEPVLTAMRSADDDEAAVKGLMSFMTDAHRPALLRLPFKASHDYSSGFTQAQARYLLTVRKLPSRRMDAATAEWANLLSVADTARATLSERASVMETVREELRSALDRFVEPRRTHLPGR